MRDVRRKAAKYPVAESRAKAKLNYVHKETLHQNHLYHALLLLLAAGTVSKEGVRVE